MSIFSEHKKALLWAVAVVVYLKYLLIPTGMLFYELHHATGIDSIYWGYSIFKGVGYYFGVWQYQSVVCVLVAALIFGVAVLRGRRSNKTETRL